MAEIKNSELDMSSQQKAELDKEKRKEEKKEAKKENCGLIISHQMWYK